MQPWKPLRRWTAPATPTRRSTWTEPVPRIQRLLAPPQRSCTERAPPQPPRGRRLFPQPHPLPAMMSCEPRSRQSDAMRPFLFCCCFFSAAASCSLLLLARRFFSLLLLCLARPSTAPSLARSERAPIGCMRLVVAPRHVSRCLHRLQILQPAPMCSTFFFSLAGTSAHSVAQRPLCVIALRSYSSRPGSGVRLCSISRCHPPPPPLRAHLPLRLVS